MKKALIGAGGFSDEIKAHMNDFKIVSFVDDFYYKKNSKNILPLSEFNPMEYEVLVAIGNPTDRLEVVKRLPENTKYFSFIHNSAQILGNDVEIGEGSIICAGVIITSNVKIGNHAHLNLLTTVGHDTQVGDFFTTAPGVKISGNCKIGNNVYLGTNSSMRQKVIVCDNVTVGLNAGVVKDIIHSGTYVGVPAKQIK